MGKTKDLEAITSFFGDKYPPTSAIEARNILKRDDINFPPDVYLALQNLLIAEMGNKVRPKKLDRQAGQRIRKKRTGSRRG